MPTRICIRCQKPFEAKTSAKLCPECTHLTVTCEQCGNVFTKRHYPSLEEPRFCSVRCRNAANAKAKELQEVPCPVCGEPFKPYSDHDARKKYCSPDCARRGKAAYSHDGSRRIRGTYLQEQRKPLEQAIQDRYRTEGPDGIAHDFDLRRSIVQNLAYKLGVTLDAAVYRDRVHESARQYMRANNPMHNPDTVQKVTQFYEDHPEAKQHRIERLLKSNSKLRRDRPSGLERKLHRILQDLGVKFERQVFIKPKFIVDVRIGSLIIQADGDYWHGHPRFKPLTNRQRGQRKRDRAQDAYLRSCGYQVVRIWEDDMCVATVRQVLVQHDILGSKEH